MRILFTTTGHAGHALPLVPFARACAQAGHDVRFATQRSRTGVLEPTGLSVVAFDDPPVEELGPLFATRDSATFEEANDGMTREVFGRIDTRAALPGVLAVVESFRPDVIVHESWEFAGALAAERHAIEHVRVNLGLAAMERWILQRVGVVLDELRAGAGLRPDPGARRLRAAPSLTLVPRSLEDLAVPGAAQTFRFRHPAPRAQTPPPGAWPAGEDPLVYLSFGSVAGRVGYYRAAIEALAPLPVRVLVTTGAAGDPAELGPLPANVRAERWVPQELIASHAAAVVCHGGSGSVLGGLAHGLPLVILPLFSTDQWANARRVAALGAGVALREEPDPEVPALALPAPEVVVGLADGVRRVLDAPGPGHAARRVASEMASLPEVETAPGVLEALAGGEAALAA